MPHLTVLIPCKDEAAHIGACLESVRPIADEILVADSGSTDATLDIVRRFGGCRIIEREYVNSADFKNWAIPQARHEWVLVVDADERVTPGLAAEIRELFAFPPLFDAYELKRDAYFLGHRIRHSGWDTPKVTRLFRKSVARYQVRRVHANVVVEGGRVGTLRHRLAHYTALDLDHFLAKQHRYATWSALDAHEAGKRASLLKMLIHAPLRFFQVYVLRRGFLDGQAGLVLCGATAYYTFLKDARLWSLQHCQDAEREALQPHSASRKAA